MCRLPLDLMTRIIEMVHVPLPVPGDPSVTWDNLRQRDLATLMRVSRLTYFIAAPLLYKEVVVNNLASFFLGVDDDIREHQEGCEDVRDSQTTICHSVFRKDGSAYQCPRHIDPKNSSSGDPQDAVRAGIFHKQQLLRFVEGVHFVYSSADRHMYGDVRIEDYVNEDGTIDNTVLRHVDVRRYLEIPDSVSSGRIRPLPKLRRLCIATWLGAASSPVIESQLVWYRNHESEGHRVFEQHLASLVYQFPSIEVCHYPSNGFLAHYPPSCSRMCYNAIHEADIAIYGERLRPGADNMVFVTDKYNNKTPLEVLTQGYWMVAQQLVDAGKTWHVGTSEFEDTKVIFVIERTMDQYYCDMTDEEMQEGNRAIENLRNLFQAEMGRIDRLNEWSPYMWKFEWIEEYPACPTCEPKWYKEYNDMCSNSSSSSSACSTPASGALNDSPSTSPQANTSE